jgi:5-methyltetrahydrofolate--homocysteine methyltransferase
MGKIIEQIRQGKVLISDGAWGTYLQAKGLKPGQCPEEWNISHPNEVFDIAKSYIDVGADMIETNSFGGSAFKLANYGFEDKVAEFNKAAAAISRKAAGHKFVLGSIGPTGKILMMGEVTTKALYEAFAAQAKALEDGGADAIMIETMSDLEEASAAVSAARENTKCEIFCTMTFEKTLQNDFRTMMGVTPSEMVEHMIAAGADLIGANCGNGSKDMIGVVKEIRKVDKEVPVLIHANAGIPIYEEGKTVFPESPEEMCAYTQQLIDEGANIIGGCCGTTPKHIEKLIEMTKN